ncbi:unnamed protein product [Cochlearia groenlandica]
MHKKKEIALGFISYLAQPPCSTINKTQATISSNAMDNHKNLEQSQASRYDKLCDLIKELSKNRFESMEDLNSMAKASSLLGRIDGGSEGEDDDDTKTSGYGGGEGARWRGNFSSSRWIGYLMFAET